MNKTNQFLRILGITLMGCFLVHSISGYATSDSQVQDVDSLGDIWIFTLDKSGSMLKDQTTNVNHARYLTPQDVASQIMDSLSRSGMLNCIDYSRDKITIFETGYGKTSMDSYGNKFNAAAPLKESFLHLQSQYTSFAANGKPGLYFALRNMLQYSAYPYQESFISQIRVLALAREIEYIEQQGLNNAFRYIHIVTITDDADDNDQWLKDYYSIKQRSLKKHNELNALQSKYMYNRLSQKGGGQMEEDMRYSMAQPMSKFKIHVYHYATLQQVCDSAHFAQNDFVQCSPLDGKNLTLKLRKQKYEADSISLVYVDEIVINNKAYPLHTYLSRKNDLPLTYAYKQVNNAVRINGQIQVSYQDSIYGRHYRKIPFEQSFTIASATSHRRSMTTLLVLIGALCAFIIWLLVILPYGRLMTVYLPSGQTFKVRRGYTFRWGKSINPLAYIVGTSRSKENRDLIAKHRCITISTEQQNTEENQILLIDSNKPLTLSQSMESTDTTTEAQNEIFLHASEYPESLKKIWLNPVNQMANHRKVFIHRIGLMLQRLVSGISPHYYYWLKVTKLDCSLVLRHSALMSRPMLIEHNVVNSMKEIDKASQAVSQYYTNTQVRKADILININKLQDKWEWRVVQLQANTSLGSGMSEVKEFLYYETETLDTVTYTQALKRLKKAVRKELKCRQIAVMFGLENESSKTLPFEIEENVLGKYLYLVEDSVQRKAICIYSPLTDQLDSKTATKMIMLPSRKNDMELYTSMIPFSDAKDQLQKGITQRESRTKYAAGPDERGPLEIHKSKKIISLLNTTFNFN